jgi:hypothetical protein
VNIADRLRAIVAALPSGSAVTLPADAVRAWLEEEPTRAPADVAVITSAATWRERLWTCPDDQPLGVHDVAEAADRSVDWVYRATSPKRASERGRSPLPCSKLDGQLTFRAADVRRWLRTSAIIVNPGAASPEIVAPR